jgi:5-methylcytosine-specific restriction endonuclease McrA
MKRADDTPGYDVHSWPACWILELIATGKLHAFYISPAWRKARAEVIAAQHGECQECAGKGKRVTASMVDHVKPLRERPDLALSMHDEHGKIQLRALCDSCHWHKHHKARPHINVERW